METATEAGQRRWTPFVMGFSSVVSSLFVVSSSLVVGFLSVVGSNSWWVSRAW